MSSASVSTLGLSASLSSLVESKYRTALQTGKLVYSKSEVAIIQTKSGAAVGSPQIWSLTDGIVSIEVLSLVTKETDCFETRRIKAQKEV
jgi:hypothetical protein